MQLSRHPTGFATSIADRPPSPSPTAQQGHGGGGDYEEELQPVQLLDEDGSDVTPRSLLNPSVTLKSDIRMGQGGGGGASSSSGGGSTRAKSMHAAFGLKTAMATSSMLGIPTGLATRKGADSSSDDGDTMMMPFAR